MTMLFGLNGVSLCLEVKSHSLNLKKKSDILSQMKRTGLINLMSKTVAMVTVSTWTDSGEGE